MNARASVLVFGLLLWAPGLRAQVAVGDSLWQAGETAAAAMAYRRAVEVDQNSVRANFRIAQALAWGNNTDSALVYLRNARVRVPDDPDLRFAEATYLGWARRFDEALLRYDSILEMNPGPDFAYVRVAVARTLSWAGRLTEAEAGYAAALNVDPDSRDAQFGLAQVRAWSGDLEGALAGYRVLEADDPTETRLLVALSQVLLWQGRSGEAAETIARVAPADTALADVAQLRTAVGEARALTVSVTSSWSHDGDQNNNGWQVLRVQGVAGVATRVVTTFGYLDAADPNRASSRVMGEIALSRSLGAGTLSGGVGLRSLAPGPLDPGGTRPERRLAPTVRLGLSQRVAPTLTLGANVSRWPLDEVAVLMSLGLDVQQVDASAAWRLTPKVTFSLGGSRLAFSDDNVRKGGTGRLAWRLPSGFTLGAFGIVFGYDFKAARYFSPNVFRAIEGTVGWTHEAPNWTAYFGGGYGLQKISTAAVQRQWHVDSRLSRRLSAPWWVEVSAGSSSSVAATAIGAYRYDVVNVGLRRRF